MLKGDLLLLGKILILICSIHLDYHCNKLCDQIGLSEVQFLLISKHLSVSMLNQKLSMLSTDFVAPYIHPSSYICYMVYENSVNHNGIVIIGKDSCVWHMKFKAVQSQVCWGLHGAIHTPLAAQ